MTAVTTDTETGTRERIIGAALALFAEQGYRGTSVGEIEAAAGLSPRSGALYKHFSSKEEVLMVAVRRHGEAIQSLDSLFELMPLGDLRAELTLLARWSLGMLDRQRTLMRILMKESDRFPELAANFHGDVVERGFAMGAEWLRRRAPAAEASKLDADAFAAVFVGALVHYRIEEVLFGRPPADADEERFVAAWVEAALAFASQLEFEQAGEGGVKHD